jgi:hypothetical protein
VVQRAMRGYRPGTYGTLGQLLIAFLQGMTFFLLPHILGQHIVILELAILLVLAFKANHAKVQ